MPVRLREQYIRDGFALPDVGSHTESIDIVDPIQEITLIFTAQNGADHNISNYLFDIVDTIEVIDGADVLSSLNAKEWLALDTYHYRTAMDWGIDEIGGHWQRCIFKIPFGIGRYDQNIGLDPAKHHNPQLRFNWNLNAVRAVGATGFVTNTLLVTVIATIVDEYPKRPDGWLMHKQYKEFPTLVTGMDYTILPTDYTHRTLFWRVNEGIKCPWLVIDRAELRDDEGKEVPFIWRAMDLVDWLKEHFGYFHQGEYWYFDQYGWQTARQTFLPGNKSPALTEKIGAGAHDVSWCQVTGCQVGVCSGDAATSLTVFNKMDGTLPFSTFAYPFGDPADAEEWKKVRPPNKMELILQQAAAGYICQVFGTQFRTY